MPFQFTKLKKENLRVAYLNAKGASHISDRERIVFDMKTWNIDILFLAEVLGIVEEIV